MVAMMQNAVLKDGILQLLLDHKVDQLGFVKFIYLKIKYLKQDLGLVPAQPTTCSRLRA
jgi:hypothetical protein